MTPLSTDSTNRALGLLGLLTFLLHTQDTSDDDGPIGNAGAAGPRVRRAAQRVGRLALGVRQAVRLAAALCTLHGMAPGTAADCVLLNAPWFAMVVRSKQGSWATAAALRAMAARYA
jgi:hypothetical protein